MSSNKVILLTYIEKHPHSPDYGKIMVSHGINEETDKIVVMPNVPLDSMMYVQYDEGSGENYIDYQTQGEMFNNFKDKMKVTNE